MMSASEQCFFCLTIVILGTSHLQNSKPLHYSAPSSWQCGGHAGTIAEGWCQRSLEDKSAKSRKFLEDKILLEDKSGRPFFCLPGPLEDKSGRQIFETVLLPRIQLKDKKLSARDFGITG